MNDKEPGRTFVNDAAEALGMEPTWSQVLEHIASMRDELKRTLDFLERLHGGGEIVDVGSLTPAQRDQSAKEQRLLGTVRGAFAYIPMEPYGKR